MQTTTLSFSNLHDHGALFAGLLRARHESYVVEQEWDIASHNGMEFDQYDTPQSRWVAVHERGDILAGIRLTPSTASCGLYSYMIRDAQKGLLATMPRELLFERAPVADHIWEASRVFIAPHVSKERAADVQQELISETVQAARRDGATQLIGFCPTSWSRWLRMSGMESEAIGPERAIFRQPHQAISLSLAGALN